jgi:hypothetical protein
MLSQPVSPTVAHSTSPRGHEHPLTLCFRFQQRSQACVRLLRGDIVRCRGPFLIGGPAPEASDGDREVIELEKARLRCFCRS